MSVTPTRRDHSPKRHTAAAILLGAAFLTALSFRAAAGIITTYAGGGTNGNFSNTIGFPATNASLIGITDVAVDLLGNVFIAHATSAALVTRVDHATGLLTRFAGTGVMGGSGDGGPATDAQFMLPKSLAVDLSGNVYVLDQVDNRVRKIDAATGLIHTVAGNGVPDFTGDGGPATNASLNTPTGIAVDVHGNLYIADGFNFVVRKVDAASGLIRGIAGQYPNPGYTGDGGPATNALVGAVQAIAVDASGDVFLLDGVTPQHVRRIDGASGIITTIAGGGAGDGASGSATNVNLNFANDLAVDNLGGLYLGGSSQVWKVDLASDTISIVTGGPTPGFGGDGGPASAALVSSVFGVAVSGTGEFFLADYGNDRVRRVTPDIVPPYAVLVDLTRARTFLDPMPAAQGRLDLVTVNGRPSVVLPNLTNANPGLFLTGTNGLTIYGVNGSDTLTLPALNSFGGNLNLVDNCGPTNINLSSLTNLGGALTISSNCAASITVASPTVGGGVTLSGSTGSITLGSPSVEGSISVSGSSGTVNLGNPNVTGDIGISTSTGSVALGSPSADGGISISTSSGSVTLGSPNVTSNLDISTSSGTITIGGATASGKITVTAGDGSSISLTGTTAGGNASLNGGSNSVITVTGGNVTGNLTYTAGDGSSLSISNGSVGGSLVVTSGGATLVTVGSPVITNNLSVTTGSGSIVDVGSPNVGGNLTVSSGSSTAVVVGTPSVGGNFTVTTGGTTNVDVSGAHVSGNTTVTTTGPTNVTLSTALGSTSVTLSNGAATMQAVLPAGTFLSNVVFSVSTVPPASLPTVGATPGGTLLTATPGAAYHFAFAIPTLNQDAALTFVIRLSALDPTNRTAFLDALNAGDATVAVLGDAPGSVMQVFPVCGLGVTPSPGGCVSVTTLDATGTPLPDGSQVEPASVRFSGVTGHFSTWAVVLAKPLRVQTSLLGNGQLRLMWPGSGAVVLETSTNLAPNSWSPAGSPTQQPDGAWQLDVSPSEPMRFYRVKAQ